MITLDDVKKARAKKILTDKEIEKMEHCIGFSIKKAYVRSGRRYFKPYRNHFYPGGTDIPVWEHLECGNYEFCPKGRFTVVMDSEERKGKWIFGETMGHSWMKCSECCVSQDGQTACFSYCPNCGAKMEGAEE